MPAFARFWLGVCRERENVSDKTFGNVLRRFGVCAIGKGFNLAEIVSLFVKAWP
jgi:hypothetical protein